LSGTGATVVRFRLRPGSGPSGLGPPDFPGPVRSSAGAVDQHWCGAADGLGTARYPQLWITGGWTGR
jgi:hypothetical protein